MVVLENLAFSMAKAVGWVKRSEPHHEILNNLVGLAALDPPYMKN